MVYQLPTGYKLYKLMGEYYAVDRDGSPFKCSPHKEVAIWNAIKGIRPDGKVKIPGINS